MTPRGAWLDSTCGWSVLSNCVIAYLMVCHTLNIASVLNLKDNLKSIAISCFNMCFHLPSKGSKKQAFIKFLFQLKIGSLILLGYNETCIWHWSRTVLIFLKKQGGGLYMTRNQNMWALEPDSNQCEKINLRTERKIWTLLEYLRLEYLITVRFF